MSKIEFSSIINNHRISEIVTAELNRKNVKMNEFNETVTSDLIDRNNLLNGTEEEGLKFNNEYFLKRNIRDISNIDNVKVNDQLLEEFTNHSKQIGVNNAAASRLIYIIMTGVVRSNGDVLKYVSCIPNDFLPKEKVIDAMDNTQIPENETPESIYNMIINHPKIYNLPAEATDDPIGQIAKGAEKFWETVIMNEIAYSL